MKKIIIISILFSINNLYSQQSTSISGTWYWNSTNYENSFELYLMEDGVNSFKGYHCAVFYNGKKMDCIEDTEPCSIQVSLTANNTYQGNIKSGFSGGQGTIQLIYDPVAQTLLFEILQEPDGEFYLPNGVIMKK